MTRREMFAALFEPVAGWESDTALERAYRAFEADLLAQAQMPPREAPLTLPTVHLNGTSAAALGEGYRQCAHAVAKTIMALEEHRPHGRDYYPQGPDALSRAESEHRDRIRRLSSVHRELEQLLAHVEVWS